MKSHNVFVTMSNNKIGSVNGFDGIRGKVTANRIILMLKTSRLPAEMMATKDI